MNVSISISSETASGVIVVPDDPNFKGTARVRLEGSSRTIDDAATQLGTSIRIAPGMPGVPVEPGDRRSIDLREAISSLPELAGEGSSVADVDPRFVTAKVIAITTRDIPVRVELAAPIALDGDPVPVPAIANIRLPESSLALLPEGVQAVATVPASAIERLADGPNRVQAVLKMPAALANIPYAQITPETLMVNLRVRRQSDTFALPSVPVWFSLPPTEDDSATGGKWTVELIDKFISDITLTGPAEDIRRIRSGELPVKAVIELSSEDLQRSISSARATFPALPPSVRVSVPNPEVRVKIGRK